MSNKTRKYAWPVSAVMAFAIVGVLAAFIVLASTPDAAIAHDRAQTTPLIALIISTRSFTIRSRTIRARRTPMAATTAATTRAWSRRRRR